MRTFVSVEITDEGILSKVRAAQRDFQINSTLVNTKVLHTTLMFLGDITKEKCEDVKKALHNVRFTPFKVTLKGLGAFPRYSKPRVMWIRMNDAKELVNLVSKVESALEPLGFKLDKPFRPHITISRIKKQDNSTIKELKRYQNVEFGSQMITRFKLKKSVLTSDGPIYSDLLEVPAT